MTINRLLFATLSGPLTAIIDGKTTLLGVFTFPGNLQCTTDLPMGYARVSDQVDWIRQNTDVDDWECSKKTR